MNKWELTLSFLFLPAFAVLTALYFQQLKPYQSGLSFLKEKNYSSARQEFLKLLGQKPFLFSARLNLAFTESLQKNVLNAVGEYQFTAENSSDKEERFQAQFNTAFLKFLSGDIPSSLEHYQKALKEKPQSLETKVNIEWILKNQAQKNKQKQQKKEEENKKSEKQNSQEKSQMEQTKKNSKKEEEKVMNEDQIQFIFKELEDREKKLRSRLNNKKGKKRKRGKSW